MVLALALSSPVPCSAPSSRPRLGSGHLASKAFSPSRSSRSGNFTVHSSLFGGSDPFAQAKDNAATEMRKSAQALEQAAAENKASIAEVQNRLREAKLKADKEEQARALERQSQVAYLDEVKERARRATQSAAQTEASIVSAASDPTDLAARAKALLEAAGIKEDLAFENVARPSAEKVSSLMQPAGQASRSQPAPQEASSAKPATPPAPANKEGGGKEEEGKKGGWGFGWPFGKKK